MSGKWTSPILLTALLPLLVGMAGCAISSTQGPSQPWELKLERSGGFAGVRQELLLTSDGQFTAEDKRRQITRSGQLERGERIRANQLVAEALEGSVDSPPAPAHPCADCVVYRLTADRQSTRVTALMRSDAVASSPYGPLIGYLDRLLLGRLEKNRIRSREMTNKNNGERRGDLPLPPLF